MKNIHISQKYISFIFFMVLVLIVLACGSNTSPGLVSTSVSSFPKKDTQINKPNLPESSVYIATPSLIVTSVYTATPSLTETTVFTASPIATADPYMWIGGDWPEGIWGYIFNPDKGARGNLKVFIREQKTLIFEIIGAANCPSMPSGQGYLVRYPNGNEEWKDRRAMENNELFILKDELTNTFRDFSWQFYPCP